MLITAAAAVVFGFIAWGHFTPVYIFDANFLVGAIIILVGLILLFSPVFLKFGKLIDHTTYGQKLAELREIKSETAYGILYLGILVILLTGAAQFVVSMII